MDRKTIGEGEEERRATVQVGEAASQTRADMTSLDTKACMEDQLPVNTAAAHTQHGVDDRAPTRVSIQ